MPPEQELIDEHIFAVHASIFDWGQSDVTESFKSLADTVILSMWSYIEDLYLYFA